MDAQMPQGTASDGMARADDYEVGQDNVEVLGLDIHNPVFFLAAGLVLLFAGLTLAFPATASGGLLTAKAYVLDTFEWLFAITPLVVLAFLVLLCVSPLGRIRLGGAAARPDHSAASWVAMLFAAGVGIGFMFYGAGEPLSYYTGVYGTPLNAEPNTPSAARYAFSATLFHWGLLPWAVYAVVGLALGYFAYNCGLPLSIRSIFYPLLGVRVWGWPGHVIDLFAVVSTIFGLATAIGLGATQASAGLGYLFGFDAGRAGEVALLAVMTSLAIVSVLRGLKGGVKLLSNVNMIVAACLLLFVIVAGPTGAILKGLVANTAAQIVDTAALAQWIGRQDRPWFQDWTIFYWAWWITWSPFVGMFIARISRGRTVREYTLVVLGAPVAICTVWFTAFGQTAISQFEKGQGVAPEEVGQTGLVLFRVLSDLPFPEIASGIAIALLVVFIVTSADSGALVIDAITSGGKTDAPPVQRAFWTALLGLTAAALLYGGGEQALKALQAGTITAALPFTFLLLASCVSLLMGMLDRQRKTGSKNIPKGGRSGGA